MIVKSLFREKKILACKPFNTLVLKNTSQICRKKTLTSGFSQQEAIVDNLLTTHNRKVPIYPTKYHPWIFAPQGGSHRQSTQGGTEELKTHNHSINNNLHKHNTESI
jgi:hypothetical protein